MKSMSTNDWITLILAIAALVSTIVLTVTQIKIAKAANSLPVGIDLLREFRETDFKKKANCVYTILKNTSDYSKLTDDQKLDIDYISHFYDTLGILVYKKVISKKLIVSFMRGNIITSWNKIKPYVDFQRQFRGDCDYQLGFEYLAKISSESKYRTSRKKMNLK